MPRERDPLSTEYDTFSQTFLSILYDDVGGWHTATVDSPAGDPVDAGGLTAHERAVQRSLYYMLNSTDAAGPLGGHWVKNEMWSLQREWSNPKYAGGILGRLFRAGRRRRVLTARMVDGASADAHASALPSSAKYTENPALQSQSQELGG